MQQTAEQRIERAIIKIMAHPDWRALAGVLMIGKRTVVDNVPTACTDGVNVKFGRAFVDSMSDRELRFLILHEEYHKLYKHLTFFQWMFREDASRANQACDYVINIKLKDADPSATFISMSGPLSVGCYNEKYRGWDSPSVFRDLAKSGGDGDGDGGSGGSFDEHDWDTAKEMTEEQKQDLAREIDSAIRQGAMAAGKTGSGGDRDFEELLQPQRDWREELAEFVSSTCSGNDYSTWNRPSRRFLGMGVYMPSGVSERIGELVLAPDTSGSTFAPGVLPRMMSELAGIVKTVKPDGVRILYWDTQICGDEYYPPEETDNIINSTQPKGGGGTNVPVVPAHMAANNISPQAAIVFTDGYLDGVWGEWPCPVLWVVVDNPNCYAPVGKTVHVTTSSVLDR